MPLIFGLDIGTTSIGFAVIEHDWDRSAGNIRRLGVRIFPEARDPEGVPLNQERRAARLRRRDRRQLLSDLLCEVRLLPARNSSEWNKVMGHDPYVLREKAFKGKALSEHEVGRALYHLAKRRHFKGRDIDEISDGSESGDQNDAAEEKDEKKAKAEREATLTALKQDNVTLGACLARRGSHERKRGVHATRKVVEEEFDKVWGPRLPENCRDAVRDAIFNQRPVFWRKNTLGKCRFVPDAPLCPRGTWLSQQRRMLEKLNNLRVAGDDRPLDPEERAAILDRLQTQTSMKWSAVKTALKPLYKTRGEAGAERRLKFNLEEGGEKTLLGNAVEAKLAKIFGADWPNHPRKQEIRDAVHDRIWQTDYGEIGLQRVVILPETKRREGREKATHHFVQDFGVSQDQAAQLAELKLTPGWEPYSAKALRNFLPHLEAGVQFGRSAA
jgi:CRISPR-associated endonuclease Csn1